MKPLQKALHSVGLHSFFTSVPARLTMLAGAALGLAASAPAADFNWTGLGDGQSWSDADNWTNAAGVAVAPTASSSAAHSYLFPVDSTGLSVVQDITGSIVVSDLAFETAGDGAAEVRIASKQQGCIFSFGPNGTVDVPADMTLVLNTDAYRWTNNDFIKNGKGRIVFDLLRNPQTQRGFVLNDGTAEVAATSADTRFLVKMGGSDSADLPVFINHKDGETIGGLDTLRNGGTVALGDTTLHVGSPSSLTGSTNAMPKVEGAGTLVFQNERVAQLSEKAPTFGITLDRADVIVPDFAANICWLFDDASNPAKDDVGDGSRMVVSGSPSVVQDAERGSVLSFTGGAYFKGPDANDWLDGFDPTTGFTVAFWLKPAANCNAAAKILFWGEGVNAHALAIRFNNDSQGDLIVTYWGGNQFISLPTLRDGAWHHIAVTFNGQHNSGNNFALYFDGSLAHPFSLWGSYAPPKKDLYIGNMAGTAWNKVGGSTPYTGLMDDFVLLPRCLSAVDIAGLCANGAASATGSPVLAAVSAKSAGVLAVKSGGVSMKTLSGSAFAGGIQMQNDGSTVAVGAGAGAAATSFKGVIGGGSATLVKEGADYALSLSGSAPSVTNVVVDGGTLTLNRPLFRQGLVFACLFDDVAEPGRDCAPGGLTLAKTGTGTLSPVAEADSVAGHALHFPGATSLTSERACKPAFFPRGNASYTISVWIRPTAEAVTGSVPICCWGNGADRQLMMLRFNGEEKIMFSNYSADLPVTGLAGLADGTWHHIVATYDGATREKVFYYDGAQKATATVSAGLAVEPGKYPVEIGHTSSISSRVNQYYTGDMDEFMVFDHAWSADEVEAAFLRTATAPAAVAADAYLPAPVARWTFDGDDPLAEASGNAALALAAANGDVTFETGDAICGKAARFSATSGFLRLDTFPADIIPTGNATFTLLVRYHPDTAQLENNIYPSIVGWGDDNGFAAGTLVRLGTGVGESVSSRAILRNLTMETTGTHRTRLATDRSRWYTAALVVNTPGFGNNASHGWLVVDGEAVKQAALGSGNPMAIAAQDFCIGSNAAGTKTFRGLVDDVRVYDKALSAGQIRMIAEQLEASKGQATTGTTIPAGVLTANPDVTVASGATLQIASTETVGNLSGAGAVEIAAFARLNISSADGFTGTVAGDGALGIADGATLEFGNGTSPLFDVDCPLAIGENVTVHTTTRTGRLLLAEADSFPDAENLATWTATVPEGIQAHFVLSSDGKKLYLSMPQPLIVFFR